MVPRKKRPRSVTILILGVIFLGLWNSALLFALIQQLSLLLPLNIKPDPRWRMLLAAGWMLLFWGSAIALGQRRAFSRWLIPLSVALYALYELLLLGLFVRVPVSVESMVLRILLATAAVVFSIWTLNRTEGRAYFQKEEGLATKDR